MLILFFFIGIIPFAITGIIAQLGYFNSVKADFKLTVYTQTFLLVSVLFYLPLAIAKPYCFLWLFWAGLILSIAYFVVKRHRQELQTNAASRLIGGLALLMILTACFIILYMQKSTL